MTANDGRRQWVKRPTAQWANTGNGCRATFSRRYFWGTPVFASEILAGYMGLCSKNNKLKLFSHHSDFGYQFMFRARMYRSLIPVSYW